MNQHMQKRKASKQKRKILGTCLLLFLYCMATRIPLPFVDTAYIQSLISKDSSLSLLNLFTGGSLARLCVMTLGMIPYVLASAVIQVLTAGCPKVRAWLGSGAKGRQKQKQLVWVSAVSLSLLEAVGLTAGYGLNGLFGERGWYMAAPVLSLLILGTILAVTISQYIDQYLFGNGTALLLAAGVLNAYIDEALHLTGTVSYLQTMLAIIFILCCIGFAVWASSCGKIILVADTVKTAFGDRKKPSYLSYPLLGMGVMPMIFASIVITTFAFICSFFGDSLPWPQVFNMAGWLSWKAGFANFGLLGYFGLVFLFWYDGQVKSTAFCSQVGTKGLERLGLLCLYALALIPIIMSRIADLPGLAALGTSIIITVSVIQETWKQYTSEMKGCYLIRKGRHRPSMHKRVLTDG